MSSALLAAGEIDGSGVESEGVQVLCEHCSEIDFNRLGIVMREELSALRSRAEFCTFCELLLRQLNKSYGFASNRTGPVEIWRVQHGLALGSRSKPLLSIYKIPCKRREYVGISYIGANHICSRRCQHDLTKYTDRASKTSYNFRPNILWNTPEMAC